MAFGRRKLLKLSGASLASGIALGSASPASARADVADVYRAADTSNYTGGNRSPSDVRWLVMHTIEGSYEAGYSWFQNPDANASSHFVVGNQPGQIMQMVDIEDIAWTQGNWGYNKTGISIEMEGYANRTDFDDTLYQQAAEVARWVCDNWDVPIRHPSYDVAPCSPYDGEGGIIGHENIPSEYDCSEVTDGKVDPGDTWDWDYFMSLVRDGGDGGGGGGGSGGEFEMDQCIVTTDDVWVRKQPGLDAEKIKVMPSGSTGTVMNGPTDKDGYTWWGVHYPNGGDDIWAWTPGNWLAGSDGCGSGGGSCGSVTETRTVNGHLTGWDDKDVLSHEFRTTGTCQVTFDLSGPDESNRDFDLYVTRDGRTPTREDYDNAAHSTNSEETIELNEDEIPDDSPFGILVDSYSGPGDYTLTIEEVGTGRRDRVDPQNVEDLAKILTTESGRYLCERQERIAVGFTVINRMENRGVDQVSDVWDAYAHGKAPSDASKELARKLLKGDIDDPTGGAVFFYSPRSMPADGDSTDGYDVDGGLEWVPGLDERHYRPGWGEDNKQVFIEGVRPRFFKFFTTGSAPSLPECGGDHCLGDEVVAVDAGATAYVKPRDFAAVQESIAGGTSGTVVGDGMVSHGGTTYAKVHWEDGTTGYTPVGSLDDPGKFEMDQGVVTTDDVWVRKQPGLDAEKIEVMDKASAGTIMNGPVEKDGYVWWGVHYSNGGDDIWAWTPQEWLADDDVYAFTYGERVETTDYLWARKQPGVDSEGLEVQPPGTGGEIVNGPVEMDGYVWWGIHYDDGLWGWSAEGWLES